MLQKFTEFALDEAGASAIDYCLYAALSSVTAVAALTY